MKKSLKSIAVLCLVAMGGGVAGTGIYSYFQKNANPSAPNRIMQNPVSGRYVNYPGNTTETLTDFTKAAEMSVHAVVHVKTFYEQRTASNPLYFDPFRDFFRGDQPQGYPDARPAEATGSGVIITDDGYIVTNNHVVKDADNIEITLNDKRTYKAKLIGTDPTTDLALLKVEEKNLPYVMYGNSDNLKVGEWVLAVGNPFNLTSTVTAGIVSAKARSINILSEQFAIESFIQTDAAVNPGNSGGALVNTKGELVGINSAIASNTGSYAGYSFAVPVNIVKKVMDDLLEFGEVQRAFIGISIRDIDSKLAEEKGIKQLKGVYVGGLTEGGAAESAGIKEGDIITRVGGTEVNTAPELQEQVGRYRPGDKVALTVLHNGKEKLVTVTLRNKNGNTNVVKKDQNEIVSLLGADFEPLSKEDKAKLKIDGGVRIAKLNGGKLRSAGIREGFIITSIDKKEINTTDEVIKALENKKGGVLIEGVYPNGMKAYYGFGL